MAAGLRKHTGPPLALPSSGFFVYAAPHEALEALRAGTPLPISPLEFLKAYNQLLNAELHHRLVASWRLEHLAPNQLVAWAADSLSYSECTLTGDSESSIYPLPASPLTAAVTSVFLDQYPECLDLYIALETRAERFGTVVDLDYSSRLRSQFNAEPLLEQWWRLEPSESLLLLELQQLEEERLVLSLTVQHQRQVISSTRFLFARLLRLFQRLSALLLRVLC